MSKFSDYFEAQKKSKIKAGDGLSSGKYKFFNSSNVQTKFYNDALYYDEALIFGTGGNASIHYCNEPFSTSTDCIVFFAKRNDFNVKLVYQYLSGNIHILQNGFKGAGIKHISKGYIEDIELNLPSIEKQQKIVSTLNKVTHTIDICNHLTERLDLLIKAKFVEMFGDPVTNPYSWEKIPLGELAEIKIGPFGTLLHKDDYINDAHALVNPSHIIDSKISTDRKLTVSNEKYNELCAYHLYIGDVVLGRRGEMGRCAVVIENGLLCGTGSLIIRSNGRLKSDYIQKILSFPSFKKTIEDMAVGQTMLNLNVPIVSNFMIICPPINVQEKYYSFAEQVNKSKSAVKQILEKAETLKKSLMQEYFTE